jgi:hypothetical protein
VAAGNTVQPGISYAAAGNTVQPGVSEAQIVNQKTIQQDNARNNAMQPEPLISLTTFNDMTELKHMLKTLMEQMGTMLNLLTTVIIQLSK